MSSILQIMTKVKKMDLVLRKRLVRCCICYYTTAKHGLWENGMEKIKWVDGVSNKEVLKRVKEERILQRDSKGETVTVFGVQLTGKGIIRTTRIKGEVKSGYYKRIEDVRDLPICRT